ncbi:ParB/RepB/Spo0J family partition protein [Desulfovirgula thermocuniculi]|uniref:ParB/RepB/Spo0J family partition protein n=1 Tax=Desulfovirgula thermocuniculi TaxID=348842 RepID=UPI0004168A4A|nr:ParB/RepB/Spo0J family partition protein [Desulfovirgula thermocuniculi]
MSKKRSLGRGLGALLPGVAPEEEGSLKELRVGDIRPNPRQPRQSLDEEKIAELAASIKEHGVVQPILVRPVGDGKYEIIAGERRWRACCRLGMEYIPAIVRGCGELEASALSLIENVQREDLNPVEEAKAYRQLLQEFGLTQEEVSRLVGKSRAYVANAVRLLGLPPEVQDMLAEGKLTAGHARALLVLEDAGRQIAVAREALNKGLTVRETEELVRKLCGEGAAEKRRERKRSREERDPQVDGFEAALGKALGTAVRIKLRRGGGGVIEIPFGDRRQLAHLVEQLT